MRNNNATKYKYRKWNAEDWEWDNKERPVNFNKWMRGKDLYILSNRSLSTLKNTQFDIFVLSLSTSHAQDSLTKL